MKEDLYLQFCLNVYIDIYRQFFGSPIQCDSGSASEGVEKDVLESYCWMYSNWNIPPHYKGSCSSSLVSIKKNIRILYNINIIFDRDNLKAIFWPTKNVILKR